jgi:hypothetical protein
MTETGTRAKHTPEEIKQNHLNAAARSLKAAAKRVNAVTAKRDKVKLDAQTVDSEHAAATAILNGARERYRHAFVIANGADADIVWPEGLTMEAEQTEDEPSEDEDEPTDDDF